MKKTPKIQKSTKLGERQPNLVPSGSPQLLNSFKNFQATNDLLFFLSSGRFKGGPTISVTEHDSNGGKCDPDTQWTADPEPLGQDTIV